MERALDEARGGGPSRRRALGAGAARLSTPAGPRRDAGADWPVLRETFAPILYVMRYSSFDEVIALHNAVGAGLSSSDLHLDLREPSLPSRRRARIAASPT
jgi:aldehyde dehydrogenase (NAD+)